MWMVVGRRLILKYAGEAVVNRITHPDEATMGAINGMLAIGWNWFLTAKIPTGKTIQHTDEGTGTVTESEESLTPYVMIMRETGRQLMQQAKGYKGGLMSQAGRDIVQGLEAGGVPLLGSLGPRKGQTTDEWAFEQLLLKAQPAIEQRVNDFLKSKVGGNNAGGW
jgi:hypothetical protein